MKSFSIIILIIFVLYCACQSNHNEEEMDITEVAPTYSLNLDKNTSNYVLSSQYIDNWKGYESFAILNKNANEIKMYDLQEGNLIDSIRYDSEGPTGVGRIYDFFIHNQDSIFLNEKFGYKIHLIDDKGVPKRTYKLIPDDTKFNDGGVPQGKKTALAEFSIFSLSYVINKNLYVNTRPDRDLMSPSYYESEELGLKLDLTTGNYSYLMGYPESYKNNIWGVSYSTTFRTYNSDADLFVYSFPIDEAIYTTKDHKSFKQYEFKSRYFKKIKPLSKPTRNPSIYVKYEYMNNSYTQIFYDNKKKLYYRLGKYNIDEEKYVEGMDPLSNLMDIAIIVHDENFNRIGEYRIKQKTNRAVLPLKAFINDSGLNIAYIDFNNEDKLNFLGLRINPK